LREALVLENPDDFFRKPSAEEKKATAESVPAQAAQ